MYLKSLTLKGFKSFADRTHMVYDPGLTVVVGPNGSGKSNVSDAILWVLGEQSAKMLRGQAMEDVIFSGSLGRQAVSVAEVTLVLDNTDHTIPVDFSEVAITRRMYRSGESEYLINSSPARLMDIQDILHDSGLGKDTHSIISQGKLDQILSSKPEERRMLIEEAAGISKHRRRKERSERKLKAMDEKLVRAKDIIRVIVRQLRPLEKQVDKAKRAHDMETRLHEATAILYVDELRSLQHSWNDIQTKKKEIEAEKELADYQLQEKKQELNRLQLMLEEKGLFVGDLSEQRRRMQDIVGRIDSDMRLLEEKGKNMVEKLSEMRNSMAQIENQLHHAKEDLNSSEREFIQAESSEKHYQEKLSELGPKAARALEKKHELEKRISDMQAEKQKSQSISDKNTLAYARLSESIANAELEDSLFKNRISALEEQLSIAQESLKELASKREEKKADLTDAQDNLQKLAFHIDELRISTKTLTSQLDDSIRELSHAQARLQALKSLDATPAGKTSPLAKALRPLLAQVGADKHTIADVISVPQDIEMLVERLLGQDISTAIVSVNDQFLTDLSSITSKNMQKGRASFVLQAKELSIQTQNDLQTLDTLIACDKALKPTIQALFGSFVLVDSIKEAYLLHNQNPVYSYATKSGCIVFADGRVVLGEEQNTQKGTLERKREISSLEAHMPELQRVQDVLKEELDAKQNELHTLQDEQSNVRGGVSQLKGLLESLNRESIRIEKEIETKTRELEKTAQQREDARVRSQDAKESLAGYKQEAEAADNRIKELVSEIDALLQELTSAVEEEKTLSVEVSDLRLKLATLTERKRFEEHRRQELKHRVEDLQAKQEMLFSSSRALDILRLRVDPLHDTYVTIQEAAWKWARRLQDRASLAEADSESLKNTIANARREVGKAHGAVDSVQAAMQENTVGASRLEVQVEQAIERIVGLGTYTLEDALALPIPEDPDALKVEVENLKHQLETIGPVNQVALEEYTKLKERHDFIAEQLEDLESARKSLIKITAAIDRKMKRQFLLTFEQVNNNFKEIFDTLFPGGKAELVMDDPDHPVETGIEIFAQPKGKKFTKMTLMSGGEKSLIALALLFAVYRTRTVPFYLFDEVEAALDAANLDKLLHAIDHLKQTTQLIVISHQRRTMEQADVLYGVSMLADGVSRVVSQRLDRATGKVVEV